MRIFVGTTETAGFIYDLGAAFQRLGHETTTGLAHVTGHYDDYGYDLDLGAELRLLRESGWRELEARLSAPGRLPRRRPGRRAPPLERMAWVVAHHDVFVFLYTSLFSYRVGLPFNMGIGRDYPLLRRLGKRIVTCFIGPEARHHHSYDQYNQQFGPFGPPIAEVVAKWGRDPLSRPLRNLRQAELHSDLVVSQPGQAALAVRPYLHLHAPVDLSRFRCSIPGRRVPLVLHAPSDRSFKGTARILEALDRLRARGVRFRLRVLDCVPHAQVVRALREADVLIDQLHAPLHGRLGVEAMASGCALATCNREDLEPLPRGRPIWHLDHARIEEQLHRLLTDRELRLRLARDGRDYVERHHGRVAVARGILTALEAGTPAAPRADDAWHWPTFYARDYRLPRGEAISRTLLRATARVIRRFGLPAGVTLPQLVRRGLLAPGDLPAGTPLPEWTV